MATRINKRRKYKLEDEGQVRLSFSTEDRMKPDVVSVAGVVWLKYHGDGDCEKLSEAVRIKMKKEIHEWLGESQCFSDRMIFDFSIFTNSMGKGVKKRLSVEVLLKRNGDESLERMRDLANAGMRPIFKRMLKRLEESGFEQCSGKRG